MITEGKREVEASYRSSGTQKEKEVRGNGKIITIRHILHSRHIAEKGEMKQPPQVRCSISTRQQTLQIVYNIMCECLYDSQYTHIFLHCMVSKSLNLVIGKCIRKFLLGGKGSYC